MLSDADKARQALGEGDHKKAARCLWDLETLARTRPEAATELRQLAGQLHHTAPGRVQKDAQLLIERADHHLERFSARSAAEPTAGLACVALGGFGWELAVGAPYTLRWDEQSVNLWAGTSRNTAVSVRYDELLAFEIGGPGAQQSGGGFAGGGFGLEGAAEGMLAAGVLNALTTKTRVVTTLSLHTADAEGFFVHDKLPPVDLRIHVSEIFVRMRRAQRAQPSATAGDPHPQPP